MPSRTIFLCAGDHSGDLHGANLMRAIKERDPQTAFAGVGLERMGQEGLEPVAGSGRPDSAMWFHNVLRAGRFRRLRQSCEKFFRTRRPDLLVLIDFGGFNLFLARAAKREGLPVMYYVPPQVWAHGAYRARKLRKWVDRLVVIYPFEVEFYRGRGQDVEYVGQPLFDDIACRPPSDEVVAGLRERFGEKLIGVFPGSRSQEVRRHLPLILPACARIRAGLPGAAFALLCPKKLEREVRELTRGSEPAMELLDVRSTELARAACLCLTKSGTITLEIASQRRPMVIFYKISGFSYFLASGMRETPYIGLVNSLAGRMICPEKLMWRSEPDWLAREALGLLRSEAEYDACRRALDGMMEGFARPGASARAAQIALDMAG